MKALSGLCGPAVRNGSNDCLFVQADGYAVRNRRHASQSRGSDLVGWSCRHWLKFAPPWSTRGYPVLGIAFLTLVRDPPPGLRLLFGDMQYVAVRFSAPGHLGFRSQRSG